MGQIQRKEFNLMVTIFLFKTVKWEKYYQKHFAPQNVPHTAYLRFSDV